MYKIELTYEQLINKLAPNRIINEQVLNNKKIFVKTPTGFSKINAVIEKSKCEIMRIIFENGSIYETSAEHLFSYKNNPINANLAEIVDSMSGPINISSKEIVANETVFDISIESPHWYISRDDGIIHHNSFFALGAAKHFLEQNPTGMVLLFESESAITKSMLVERGIDTKRFGVIPVATVQEFRNQALKIISNYEKDAKKDRQPLFFILDSLGMLSTAKEMTDSAEGNDTRDMTRAQLVKASFRVLTLRLGMANIPMFVTNHVYDAIGAGPYASKVQGGGCLVAGTLILMSDGTTKPIDEVSIGDLVMTHLGEPGQICDKFIFDNKDVYEIEFEDGSIIHCSGDHKFLIDNDWVEAKYLSEMTDCMVI